MDNLNNNKSKKEDNILVIKTSKAETIAMYATVMLVIGGATNAISLVPHWLMSSVEATATTEVFTSQDLGLATEEGLIEQGIDIHSQPKAPMAASQDGNNVYIVWWTNKSENWEVMFRASTDGGQTFGDKINLSNSSDAESQNAEIVSAGNNRVLVSWWETNPVTGSSESVLRVSNDSGKTFGPMVMLGMNEL